MCLGNFIENRAWFGVIKTNYLSVLFYLVHAYYANSPYKKQHINIDRVLIQQRTKKFVLHYHLHSFQEGEWQSENKCSRYILLKSIYNNGQRWQQNHRLVVEMFTIREDLPFSGHCLLYNSFACPTS